jgi:hypothetical protein
MKEYVKNPEYDSSKTAQSYLKKDRGLFFYFRHMCMRMQSHFITLIDHQKLPKVFIHGNPHTENYVITDKGAGMVDFDRSRIGAYAWDIVRFLSSVSLKRAEENTPFLSPTVLEYFKEGYIRGFEAHKMPYKEVSKTLDRAEFEIWYETTREYLAANVKWAKEMRKSPVKPDNKLMVKILEDYLKSRKEEDLLKDYVIEEAGKAKGTFGNKRILVALAPKKNQAKDKILIELKTVYQDEDNKYYFNPFKHHGLRMIKASELYAPNIEERLGYATHKGQEYWGREIPSKSAKIKDKLNEFEQVDISYSVATQLGKAHRQSLEKDVKANDLAKHFLSHYDLFVALAMQMNLELTQAYRKYVEDLQKATEESVIEPNPEAVDER